jgi:hypothetical protein
MVNLPDEACLAGRLFVQPDFKPMGEPADIIDDVETVQGAVTLRMAATGRSIPRIANTEMPAQATARTTPPPSTQHSANRSNEAVRMRVR